MPGKYAFAIMCYLLLFSVESNGTVYQNVIRKLGGHSDIHRGVIKELSPAARELLSLSLDGIPPQGVYDYHVHVLGTGNSNSEILIGKPLTDTFRGRLVRDIYLDGGGIKGYETGDSDYINMLQKLVSGVGKDYRALLLPYDKSYLPGGKLDVDATMFYVPTDYAQKLSKENARWARAAMSVNPYRIDALALLESWGKRGVRYVKWSPPMMEIAPDDEAIIPFYRKMKEHNIALISHGGPYALARKKTQDYGNPVRLHLPLSLGVKVIVAHSAAEGSCNAQRDGEGSAAVASVPCFTLFISMLENPKYTRLLFGDISATVNSSTDLGAITTLVARRDLHRQLVYGSDYPGPLINVGIKLSRLVDAQLLEANVKPLLQELYHYNPLLFNLALMRSIKHPDSGRKFPPAIFAQNPSLP